MLSLIKKSLIWIVSGAATVILTACYGPAVCLEDRSLTKKLTFLDPQGTPIPELKITRGYDVSEYFTDANGQVTVSVSGPACGSACIYIEDVDGEAHGYFPPQDVCFSDYSDEEPETIILQPGEMPDDDSPGLPNDQN